MTCLAQIQWYHDMVWKNLFNFVLERSVLAGNGQNGPNVQLSKRTEIMKLLKVQVYIYIYIFAVYIYIYRDIPHGLTGHIPVKYPEQPGFKTLRKRTETNRGLVAMYPGLDSPNQK